MLNVKTVTKLENMNTSLENQSNQAIKNEDSQKNTSSQNNNQTNFVLAQRTSLGRELDSPEGKILPDNDPLTGSREKIQALKKSNATISNPKNDDFTSINELALSQSRPNFEAIQATDQRLQEENERLQLRIRELEEDLRLKESQLLRLNERNSALQQDCNLLRLESEGNLTQYKALQKNQTEWREERNQLNNQIKALHRQLDDQRTQLDDYETKF